MVNFSRSVLKILHRAEKIYTGGARGARDKYEVCIYVDEIEAVGAENREPIFRVQFDTSN